MLKTSVEYINIFKKNIIYTIALLLFFISANLIAANITDDSIKIIPQTTNSRNRNARIAFSPDSKTMAVAGTRLTIWNAEGYFIVKHAPEVLNETYFISFIDNGKKLVAAHKMRGKISVYDLLDGKIVKELRLNQPSVSSLNISSDGKKLMLGTSSGNLEIFELDSGSLVKKIETDQEAVEQAIFVQGDRKIIYIGGKSKDTIKLCDTNGTLLKKYTYEPGKPITAFAFAQDRKHVALGYGPKIQVLDAELNVTKTAKVKGEDSRTEPDIVRLALSPDGGLLAVLGKPWVTVFDMENFSKISNYKLASHGGIMVKGLIRRVEADIYHDLIDEWSGIFFSPDSKTLVVTTSSSEPRLLDPYSGTLIETLGRTMDRPTTASVIPESGVILSAPPAKLWELNNDVRSIGDENKYAALTKSGISGRYVFTNINGKINVTNHEGVVFKQFPSQFNSRDILGISLEGGLAAFGWPGTIRIIDFKGNIKKDIKITGFASAFSFNSSGDTLAFADYRNMIQLWKLPEFKLIKETTGDKERIKGLDFSRDGRFLLSVGENGIITLRNLANMQQVNLISRGDDWVMYTPDGYFDGSSHGGELLAVADGLNGYGIEQFAAVRNRPDLILERMEIGTLEENKYFQELYLKRLKKMGLTEAVLSTELHAPTAKILKTYRSGKVVNINFQLSDSKYALKRYNIYINEVPVLGAFGKEISGKLYNGNEEIELANGRSKIELSVFNEAGSESLRATTYANNEEIEKGELYYLAFGVSEYKKPELNLKYADKDAKDLGSVMQEMLHGYSYVNVKTLLNSAATAENIINSKDFLKDSKVNDTVVLFAAGHGGRDRGQDSKYYFLPYEADPENLSATAVDFETIENLLNDIKPRTKLFLLDTCESGELDEETFDRYYAAAEKNSLNPRTYRKPSPGVVENLQAGPRSRHNKGRFIHNNLLRRSGAVVFSSSRGEELSYESSSMENGFFSYEIKNALRNREADTNSDNRINAAELLHYVAKAVAEKTGGLQHPTIDRDNRVINLSLPRATNISEYGYKEYNNGPY